jgi:polyphosphate kinase 2 (PPK2 family)
VEAGDGVAVGDADLDAGAEAERDEPEDEADKVQHADAVPLPIRPRSILQDVEMGENPRKSAYEADLARLQGRLHRLHRSAAREGVAVVVVFEGWDAAGKGGAIRRMTAALDARHYRVLPFAAPTDEERARHYLWRFWRHLGAAGSVTIFDRSWYGRVLVERIEGFATGAEWQRAYAEINHFERQLVAAGTVLVKLWLHISPEEQAARFAARAETPYKQWKITDEDWRNRSRWAEYEAAVHDMVERTSTAQAPWQVVPADHKRLARLMVLDTVCDRLAAVLPAGADEGEGGKGSAKGGKKGGKGGKKGGKKGDRDDD